MNSAVVVTKFIYCPCLVVKGWFSRNKGSVPNGGDRLKYRMTVAGQWRRIFSTSSVKEQVYLFPVSYRKGQGLKFWGEGEGAVLH